tara:strand:+ start:2679 stop:3053 length:375 start_codon:yes stop_codon:yes gene_type:complete
MAFERMMRYCPRQQIYKNKVVSVALVTLMTRSVEHVKEIADLITKQLGGNPQEDQELVPDYGIGGTGALYCYQYGTRAYIKIARGQKVWIIDEKKDHLNRVLIYTSCGRIVEIDFDELFCTEAD